ncbi:MAG TPA: amidohydrolase family protein, partial [Candidatus Paceibacterota bacterium]
MASYSILIKGGEVLRGRKFERLDVGIKDDKIQDVGDLSGAKAELLIDASGKYVAPGFIDLTSHSDTHWTLFAFPGQESLLAQGITTILGGNCGASLAPLVKAEDIGGISKWADVREININWQSTAEFLRELEKHSLGVNFAALVGHGTLRRGVLGHESRKASREEISKLTFLLEKSLEEGAFGLSTSLAAAHARNTTAEELLSLFREVGRAGGLTKHHLRDEGKNILPAIVELISLGRQSQAKIHFSHFKLLGRQAWELFPETLALIESAREEELHLTLDVFPYARTGSLLYLLLPPWVLEGGLDKILQSLREPSRRQAILEYLKSLTLHYDQMTIA